MIRRVAVLLVALLVVGMAHPRTTGDGNTSSPPEVTAAMALVGGHSSVPVDGNQNTIEGNSLSAGALGTPVGQKSDLMDVVVDVRPDQATNWVGYAREGGTKNDGSSMLFWCKWNTVGDYYYRGWTRFNLAGIPSNATITAATLYYYVYNLMDVNPEARIARMSVDPLTANGYQIWSDIGSGTQCGYRASQTLNAWNDVVLDGNGIAAIQEGLGAGWCALGWHTTQDVPQARAWVYGWSSAERPYIRVTYVTEVHDVGVSHITAPSSIADYGTAVTPACSVYNYGNQTESYDVRMKIGDSYDRTAPVAAHAPGTRVYVEFPTWNVEEPLGNVAVSCSTELTDDFDNSNDKQSGTTFVRKLDAGVLSLTSPSGMYTPGQSVNPEATWRNYGNTTVDFEAWVILNDPTDAEQYREKVDLSGIAPGGNIQVSSFPGYTVNTPGIWTVRCSTGLAGDVNPDNDILDDEFVVGSPDMRALAILTPVGRVDTSAVVVPSATVKNEGTVNIPFRVWFIMNSPGDAEEYREYLDIAGIAPGGEQTYPFPGHNVGTTEGQWTTRCSVYVASDQNTANDFINGNFTVAAPPPWETGWHEAASVPAGDGKALKDGAWLAVGEDATDAKKVIYAAKGNKSAEFYRYDPTEGESGTWLGLAAIPADEGGKNKLPSKGCVGTFGDGSVYMTKGNNTLGFWRYDVGQDSWYKLTDVPAGAGKNIKGGNDLVYVKRQHEDGYVYLLKGGDTEFYRYNTETGIWETLISAPYGGGRAKYNKGSFLVYRRKGQSVQDIYVHQAAYNDGQHHYMFRYDAIGDSWADGMLKGIPVYGLEGGKTKKKKSKDGAAGVWYDDAIYALKGGNTQGFFKYYPEGDSWTQEPDTVPMLGTTLKKKRVKGGGDLVLFDDAFFAFKGNKTYEFWRYVEPTTPMMATRPGRDGVAAGVIGNGEWRMGIGPNPLKSGFATLRVQGSKGSRVQGLSVTVFDAAGRCVLARSLVIGDWSSGIPLDLRGLSGGVYLVRLDADNFTQTQKLVVQK